MDKRIIPLLLVAIVIIFILFFSLNNNDNDLDGLWAPEGFGKIPALSRCDNNQRGNIFWIEFREKRFNTEIREDMFSDVIAKKTGTFNFSDNHIILEAECGCTTSYKFSRSGQSLTFRMFTPQENRKNVMNIHGVDFYRRSKL